MSKYESPVKDAEPSAYFKTYLQKKIRDKILQHTPREKSAAKVGSPSPAYSPIKTAIEIPATPSPNATRSTIGRAFTKQMTPTGPVTIGKA